jgi:hypothetical protein
MKAALEGGLREQPQAGVEYYRQALDLVEWGRTIWKDVPKSSRGAIFEHSFLIGIRSLYLKMFMHVGCVIGFLGRKLNRMAGIHHRPWLELQVPSGATKGRS